MGLVYEAADSELGRRVAVKLMHRELTASPEATARFRREAKAAASLSHPNIVTVHDFGVDQSQGAYLVMELLQGVSLREELRRAGRLPSARALEVLTGIVAGVEAAHDRGLLHRDLKPENVFLVRTQDLEIPKVLDFGIAKTLGGAQTATVGLTTPGHVVGTPRYMSPEQLQGTQPSPSWDTWAIALIGYELLTGHYPFPTERVEDWQRAISNGQVGLLREHFPDAPAGAERLFERVLAPEPADRPGSPRQLLEELRRTFAPSTT
jgi:serine/threonine-protein kinase